MKTKTRKDEFRARNLRLLDKYYKGGRAEEDKKELAQNNLNLVYKAMNKMGIFEKHQENFVSIGVMYLLRAIDRFDPNKGAFSTYAMACIISGISREISSQSTHIKSLSIDREPSEGTLDRFLADPNTSNDFDRMLGNVAFTDLLSILSDDEKELIMLIFEQQKSLRDVAVLKNTTVDRVVRQRNRALKKLRKALDP